MISGGDGWLNKGEVKLQQFVLSNSDPIMNEEFISLFKKELKLQQFVLLNSDPIMNEEFISLFKKEVYRTLEFQIIGTPEKGFYIWYRIVKKTCPIMK